MAQENTNLGFGFLELSILERRFLQLAPYSTTKTRRNPQKPAETRNPQWLLSKIKGTEAR
jgi:hypothetical protein